MASSSLRVGRDVTAEERRTAVLRAAVEAVATTGYDNLRLRDVAKAASVSIGLLQHYFESRDELVAQAFRQASEDLLQEWEVVVAASPRPWERIDALVSQLALRDELRKHTMVWLAFANASARNPTIREQFRMIYVEWDTLLRGAIEDGVATGLFKPLLPVSDIVALMLSQIDGCELVIAADPEAMTGSRMRELALRMTATLLRFDGYRDDSPASLRST